MGGVCAFANPEPIAPFMDFVVVGEGEEIVGEIVAAYREAFGATLGARRRDALLDRLAPIPGIYVPQRYAVAYRDDGTIAEVRRERGAPGRGDEAPPEEGRRLPDDLPPPDAERGVRPPGAPRGREGLRPRLPLLPGGADLPAGPPPSLEALRETVREIKKDSTRVGLVGACVSDYPWIGGLMKVLEEEGLEVSISSIRADSLTEELVSSLAAAATGRSRWRPRRAPSGSGTSSARTSPTRSSTRPATWSARTASRTSSATS